MLEIVTLEGQAFEIAGVKEELITFVIGSVDDDIEEAWNTSKTDLLCYINSDQARFSLYRKGTLIMEITEHDSPGRPELEAWINGYEYKKHEGEVKLVKCGIVEPPEVLLRIESYIKVSKGESPD